VKPDVDDRPNFFPFDDGPRCSFTFYFTAGPHFCLYIDFADRFTLYLYIDSADCLSRNFSFSFLYIGGEKLFLEIFFFLLYMRPEELLFFLYIEEIVFSKISFFFFYICPAEVNVYFSKINVYFSIYKRGRKFF
jgi:hypothetical protein